MTDPTRWGRQPTPECCSFSSWVCPRMSVYWKLGLKKWLAQATRICWTLLLRVLLSRSFQHTSHILCSHWQLPNWNEYSRILPYFFHSKSFPFFSVKHWIWNSHLLSKQSTAELHPQPFIPSFTFLFRQWKSPSWTMPVYLFSPFHNTNKMISGITTQYH